MTTQTEALKLALEGLEESGITWKISRAITAIKEALAHPEQEPVAYCDIHHLPEPCVQCAKEHEGYNIPPQPKETEQEPVAWMDANDPNRGTAFKWKNIGYHNTPLYTTPPKRKPLTDEEIAKIASTPAAVVGSYVHTFARAIEAAHGIKE